MVDLETCFAGVRDLVVVVNGQGAILYASPSVERVLGHDTEAVVGDGVLDYIHPDDRDRVEAALQASTAEADADVEPVRYRVRHADGSWVAAETTSAVRRDPETEGYAIVATVIDELAELERDLERYEVLLDSLDDGVYAIRPDGEIVYVNERYARMKGVDRDDLLGTDIYEWGSEDAIEKIRPEREALEAGEEDVGVVDIKFSTVDGETIPVELRFSNVSQPGEGLERVGVIRDISERKARVRALREKNERLEEFASVVSHDLQNPLNVAHARVRMALEEGTTEGLVGADDALERCHRMIEDLLELAREELMVEESEPVPLIDAVHDAWRSTAVAEATLTVEESAEVSVLANPTRLRSLLENLLGNAVQHGGDDVRVVVGATDDGFFVEDDGHGIRAEEHDRVFETGYTTGQDGTGFGLEIVERAAEAHGWSVTVSDGADGGARFDVTGVEFAGE